MEGIEVEGEKICVGVIEGEGGRKCAEGRGYKGEGIEGAMGPCADGALDRWDLGPIEALANGASRRWGLTPMEPWADGALRRWGLALPDVVEGCLGSVRLKTSPAEC